MTLLPLPGTDSIQVSGVGIDPASPLEISVFPPLSFESTTVVMDNLFVPTNIDAPIKPVRVTVDPMDDNRVRSLPDGLEFEIRIDGESHTFFSPAAPGSPATVQIMPTEYEPGSIIEVYFGGQLLGEPATVTGYETVADLVSHISVEKSRLSTSFGNCRADGMDRVAVVFKPLTDEGNSFPLTPLSGQFSIVGEHVSTAIAGRGNSWREKSDAVTCGV